MKTPKGFKTSEFYVALAGVASLLAQQVQARCQFDSTFLYTTAGIVITYIAGRSWVKGRK